jgi:hypothetical protein
MNSKSVYKIPEGKLLKVYLDYDKSSNKILKIEINGDFFAYPEEGIEILENELKDVQLSYSALKEKIQLTIQDNHIEFIGLNVEGLVEGIMMCLK